MKVRFSRRSNADLQDIYLFHAQRNPTYARRLTDELVSTALDLATFPNRGSPQPNACGRPLRRLVEKGHLIVYTATDDGVVIVRVAHSLRDIESLLADIS